MIAHGTQPWGESKHVANFRSIQNRSISLIHSQVQKDPEFLFCFRQEKAPEVDYLNLMYINLKVTPRHWIYRLLCDFPKHHLGWYVAWLQYSNKEGEMVIKLSAAEMWAVYRSLS